jgi:hypothetical protein
MKLKPTEVLLLACAGVVGFAAYFFQTIESDHKADYAPSTPPTSTTPIFADQTTLTSDDPIAYVDTTQARNDLTNFYLHFQQLFDPDLQNQAIQNIIPLLSTELRSQISEGTVSEQRALLVRQVGIVVQPQEVAILKLEQTSPENLQATVTITLPNGAKVDEQVLFVQENRLWKISQFSNTSTP